MCRAGAPAARAASTYSRSRNESTCPRTSRAVYIQPNRENTMMIVSTRLSGDTSQWQPPGAASRVLITGMTARQNRKKGNASM